ncbi:hypothetical protein AGDE_01483 [Angomonas deanei]|uniref:Uncharacterized protein n=1 Tax=Angomonas deanei TaxID=59799 RepID=S9X242_9TRYP|nr:hypothetical protein AGDE_04850 [Angomonas deanei]EPY42440.1 hypothetical protein AGDE_01483 [Angomonas deanei]CAD2214823.1 hypothetical protein, conserved [Angomonas deanei]|eukprot:EPY39079.1 hypothetical protein AGDE_04850 [Angomonas deanei]
MKAKSLAATAKMAKSRSSYLHTLAANTDWSRKDSGFPILTKRAVLSQHQVTLPDQWVHNASLGLQDGLADIVPKDVIASNDLFLCSLIHPSYIQSSTLPSVRTRAEVMECRGLLAMPTEATRMGTSCVRLLQCTLDVHSEAYRRSVERKSHGSHANDHFSVPKPKVDKIDAALLRRLVQMLQLDEWLLYDRELLPPQQNRPPDEVLLSASTALCGSVALYGGPTLVARLLDHVC